MKKGIPTYVLTDAGVSATADQMIKPRIGIKDSPGMDIEPFFIFRKENRQ